MIAWSLRRGDLWRLGPSVVWQRLPRLAIGSLVLALMVVLAFGSWLGSAAAVGFYWLIVVVRLAFAVSDAWREAPQPLRMLSWDQTTVVYQRGTEAPVTLSWSAIREIRRLGGSIVLTRQQGHVAVGDILIPRRALSADQARDLLSTFAAASPLARVSTGA